MKSFTLLLVVILSGLALPVPGALTAEQIARNVQDRDSGKDSRAELRMKLYDRRGRVRDRALSLLTLRRAAGDKSLIRFTYPNDIRGTGFLVWEHPQGEDERFLYLPSLGRVRRIAGSEAQESFVGSDLTFEDIGGREFDDYAYRLIDDPNAAWTGPDGVNHPVYTLESRRRDANARFPRVVSRVRRDNFVVVHAVIYNRRDEPQKTFEVLKLEQVKGYWTSSELRMTDALQRTRTELVLDSVEYDVGLKPDAFSRRELERGGGS